MRYGSSEPDRLAADEWEDSGLVLTTAVGTATDAAIVRRDLRRAPALVPGIDLGEWTPRELRHSFVSVLSDAASRSNRLRSSSATAEQPSLNLSTGTSSGP